MYMYKEYRTTLPYTVTYNIAATLSYVIGPTHSHNVGLVYGSDPLPAMPGGVVKGVLGNPLALLPSDNLQPFHHPRNLGINTGSHQKRMSHRRQRRSIKLRIGGPKHAFNIPVSQTGP